MLTTAYRDVAFDLGSLPLFLPGGAGHQLLTSAGLRLGSFKVPCQECGGEEGYFAMDYKVTSHHCITWYQLCGQGIHVEMYGVTTPTSRHLLPPHLRHAPTRVEVGPGLWARTLAHPGQLARGLYGRGYLYHVQVTASIHIYTYLHQSISTPVFTYLQHKYLHIYTIIHIYTPLYISTPVTSIHISTPVSTYLHQYLLSTVQSWRHVPGMEAHPMEYTPGAWQPCHQPGHHACLNNYPIQVACRLQHSFPAHKLTSTLSG